MSWWAVEVRLKGATLDLVAAWLVGRSGQSVEERAPDRLLAYAPDAGGAARLCQGLRHAFDGLLETELSPVADVDWSARWREGLGPRRIGRLTVTPSWLAPPDDPHTLVIDPETAFGTGEHGSTRAVLALLERHLMPGGTVLDLGSGSGILAIAAAKLGAARAVGVELDPEAIPVAEANAGRNGVSERVRFLCGDAACAPLLGPVQLVVCNILQSANLALLSPVHSALAPGGVAIFGGLETAESARFLPALAQRGFLALDQTTDEGWWAVAARRP